MPSPNFSDYGTPAANASHQEEAAYVLIIILACFGFERGRFLNADYEGSGGGFVGVSGEAEARPSGEVVYPMITQGEKSSDTSNGSAGFNALLLVFFRGVTICAIALYCTILFLYVLSIAGRSAWAVFQAIVQELGDGTVEMVKPTITGVQQILTGTLEEDVCTLPASDFEELQSSISEEDTFVASVSVVEKPPAIITLDPDCDVASARVEETETGILDEADSALPQTIMLNEDHRIVPVFNVENRKTVTPDENCNKVPVLDIEEPRIIISDTDCNVEPTEELSTSASNENHEIALPSDVEANQSNNSDVVAALDFSDLQTVVVNEDSRVVSASGIEEPSTPVSNREYLWRTREVSTVEVVDRQILSQTESIDSLADRTMVQDSTYLSDDPASGSEFFKLAMDVLQPTTKTEMETYVEFLRQLSDKIWKKWDENSKRNSSDVDALCDLLSKVDMSRDEIDIRRERAAIGGPLVRRQDIQATGIVVNERPVEVNSSIRLIGGVDEKVDEVVQAMNSLVLIDNVNRVEGIAVANNLRPSINQEEQMHTSSGLWAPTQANFSMYNGAHDNGNTAWAVSSADADSDDDTLCELSLGNDWNKYALHFDFKNGNNPWGLCDDPMDVDDKDVEMADAWSSTTDVEMSSLVVEDSMDVDYPGPSYPSSYIQHALPGAGVAILHHAHQNPRPRHQGRADIPATASHTNMAPNVARLYADYGYAAAHGANQQPTGNSNGGHWSRGRANNSAAKDSGWARSDNGWAGGSGWSENNGWAGRGNDWTISDNGWAGRDKGRTDTGNGAHGWARDNDCAGNNTWASNNAWDRGNSVSWGKTRDNGWAGRARDNGWAGRAPDNGWASRPRDNGWAGRAQRTTAMVAVN